MFYVMPVIWAFALYISGTTDPNWDDDDLGFLKTIPGSDFEAIDTGPLTTTGS